MQRIHFRVFKVLKLSSILISFLAVSFISLLLLFSGTSLQAAVNGINLCLNVVFPALFPFFVGSEILNKTGFVKAMGILLEPVMRPLFNVPGCGSFAFAMGITSGYPMGAKITTDMRMDGLLTKTEAERLLCFTNNSGPLFMCGAVATGMYKNPALGLLFMLCHYLACITVGMLFRFYKFHDKNRKNYPGGNRLKRVFEELTTAPVKERNFVITFGNAVINSVNMMLVIGGFIVFFSVVINLLLSSGIIKVTSGLFAIFLAPAGVNPDIVPSLVSGFFETTTGNNLASWTTVVPFYQQLSASGFILGWAGLSVHSQVISIISKTDISIKPYLLAKFFHGILAGIYTCLMLNFTNIFTSIARPVFGNNEALRQPDWMGYFTLSCIYLAFTILIMTVISLTIKLAGKYILRTD